MDLKTLLANCIHEDPDELTAFPYWILVHDHEDGGVVHVAGIWFSHERAEAHRKKFAHRLPAGCYVYCCSGSESVDWRTLLRTVDAMPEAPLEPEVARVVDVPIK